MKTKFKLIMGIKIIAGITFFLLLFGFVTMLLWNWLVPNLFNGPHIVFWQAIGLLLLSKILFGGRHHGWGGRGRCSHRGHWKERMKERLINMTPEEREKFVSRCGRGWWSEETEKKEQE